MKDHNALTNSCPESKAPVGTLRKIVVTLLVLLASAGIGYLVGSWIATLG
ncbi:MAG: hypothetical protein WBN56_08380 [Robiginitalea sp.]